MKQLMPVAYSDLRRIARRQLAGERADHSLDSVALVNEAFMSLAKDSGLAWNDGGHFFRAFATSMRRILVDHARARNAIKRGGGIPHAPMNGPGPPMAEAEAERIMALDRALERLSGIDETATKIVEHRYFAGATEEEAARALGISAATARRRWAFAKAWLRSELYEPTAD